MDILEMVVSGLSLEEMQEMKRQTLDEIGGFAVEDSGFGTRDLIPEYEPDKEEPDEAE